MLRPGTKMKLSRTLPLFLVPALVGFFLSGPAVAQHGGGGHGSGGGHAGGFSSSAGGGFHGGFSGAARSSAGRTAAPVRGASPYAARPGYGGSAFGPRFGQRSGVSAARPAFYNRAGARYPLNRGSANGYGFRGRGNRFGYGYGYPGLYASSVFYNPFFFDPFFGFGDPFYWNDGDAFWDSGSVNGPDANLSYGSGAPYEGSEQSQAAPYGAQPYGGQPSPAYGPETEPGPWAQPSGAPQGSAPMHQEDLVTIVFKDGRPAEHIRNYALTRSALLVTDARMREIPLDEIDLTRTQRVNQAAGIDFKLPQRY